MNTHRTLTGSTHTLVLASTLLLALGALLIVLLSSAARPPAPEIAHAQGQQSAGLDTEARFATFNASLNRSNAGDLIDDLADGSNTQAQAVAEIIQRTAPDVLLVNEFDYDASGTAAQRFQDNYLSVSQNGAPPIEYPYVYLAPSNTGIDSGFDLDNDDATGGPGDAYGFGFFPGQFGMVLYSQYPIITDSVRTFQTFLWKDMPDALLPDDPDTAEPADWYSQDELDVFRLSSKSHWDVPINVNGRVIHTLVSHPTPPVFDGPEDYNGRRNHDEIRFWADYVTPDEGSYIYDDDGVTGGLPEGASFVIMGDQNADPFDGDSTDDAILQLLDNPYINTSVTPSSEGGPEQAALQGGENASHTGNPAYDTADFNEPPGNLRADYVLPSVDLSILDAGVFWPLSTDPLFSLVGTFPFPSSDHRLVWVDVIDADRRTVTNVELLGTQVFTTGTTFQGTEVGGLSAIAYDPDNDFYYVLSDDRGGVNDPRMYTVTINLDDGSLDSGDVSFEGVITLLDDGGSPFASGSIDPEGLALASDDTLYLSSEGDAGESPPIDPFVSTFTITGQQVMTLTVPAQFLPRTTLGVTTGIRDNLAFESLTLSPDERFLYTAVENALEQDGPTTTLTSTSLSRVIQYDVQSGQPIAQYVYPVSPIPSDSDPPGIYADNGLVEMLALDNNGTLLALERSFAVGVGNTIRLFEASSQGALDVSNEDDLYWEAQNQPFEIDPPIAKQLLVDLGADLGISPDNVEGMSFGPQLDDGRQTLILVSDNNFNSVQETQFIALALTLDTIPAVQPDRETPRTIDEATPPGGNLAGDSDDPAIWVHPVSPTQSLVLATLKDGGMVALDLDGTVTQNISPTVFGDERYNNVDLVYGFDLDGQSTDLAVASDRANDTLAIFAIDPDTGQLSDVTASNIIETIFGVDDGEQTAYGLATYTSPLTGRVFVFVTQADGNQVAQLELTDNGSGQVQATIVRTLTLPVPTGDPSDSQAEGTVVDRELGYLYVAMEEETGILKFDAEPDGLSSYQVIHAVSEDYLQPDIEGLTIYYGADGTGYLLASSQGDHTFAVFSRQGNNPYLGNFTIVEQGDIDQTNESDGVDVTSVALGPNYPNGLLVVQDGANDPQNVVQDEEELENNSTNFKFVPWENVAGAFDPPLIIDTESHDPRNIEFLGTFDTYLPMLLKNDTTR